MDNYLRPVTVGLPVRGEWLCPNTPGSRIPSHGTNALGTRYAVDFVRVDGSRRGFPAYRASFVRYLLFGLPLADYYCYGEAVFAPFAGVVVSAAVDCPERPRTNLLADSIRAYKNARFFDAALGDPREIAGNYIIIKRSEGVYAALCHLQPNSVAVSVGERIAQGQPVARVGHTGNSYAPHLHFQLMDSADIARARGVPCAFAGCELRENGAWKTVSDFIPKKTELFRSK